MTKRDVLTDCHPVSAFAYFAAVFAFSMVLMHPLCLALSLAGALSYHACLRGGAAMARAAARLLPLALLSAAVNVAFNHAGVTVLGYFPSGNPLTAESLWFGLAAAGMLCAVLLWFSCCAAVMTSEKLHDLLGRVSPHLSLLLSMTLRFVPRFRAHLAAVYEAQKLCGNGPGGVRSALRAFSATLTWALEGGVEQADSMRARGYGLPGRTAFSLYRMDGYSIFVLILTGILTAVLLALRAQLRWRYFPYLTGVPLRATGAAAQAAYALLCFLPAILHGKEAAAWMRSRSAT